MNDWVNRIESSILSRNLLRDGESVLVAVSGGLDSMVLLSVLARLAHQRRWKLHVAHFNHQLRGRSSDADERLVCKTAAKLNIPVSVGQGNVRTVAREQKLSIEMAARQLRHQFLAATARERRIRKVALAHHADDQLELLFLRLQRGAGGEGLSGMKWNAPSPACEKIRLIRPFLGESREVLEAFAHENRVAFREDETNRSADYLRNRIRQEIIPVLKAQQPPIFETALRSMDIIGAEAEFVRKAAEHWRENREIPFNQLHIALQRRIIHDELKESRLPVEFDLVERLRAFPGKVFPVGQNLVAFRDSEGKLHHKKSESHDFRPDAVTVKLGKAGICAFGGWQFEWKIVSGRDAAIGKRDGIEFFDADAVGRRIELRHWRPGDRFEPIGLGHRVKLQDWFVNLKIPPAERRKKVVAVAENEEIFWVEGLRISDRFKLKKDSVRKLKWVWKSA